MHRSGSFWSYPDRARAVTFKKMSRLASSNQTNQPPDLMKILRNCFLALAGLAMAATTQAGTPLPPPPAPPAPAVGGPYLTLHGGALWLEDASISGVNLDFDTGFSITAALGYSLGNGLAFELESGYLQVDSAEASFRGFDFDVEGDFRQVPILVNVVYNLDLNDRLALYVGAGAGVVWSDVDIDSVGGFNIPGDVSADQWNFAAQAKAGVSFKLSEAASLNVGYRFLYGRDALGDVEDSESHVLEGGFTFRF